VNQLKRVLEKLLNQYEPQLRDAVVWAAVAAATWAIAALRTWLSTPDDGLMLAFGLGNDSLDPTYNVTSSAGLALALRFLAPIAVKLLLKLLGLLLLIVAVAPADAAEILGPETFREHSLGEYQARVDKDAGVLWFAYPRDQISMHRLGDRLIFTGPPGRYTIEIAEIVSRDGKADIVSQPSRVVEIVGKNPGPPGPGPTPPPGPGPSPPPAPPGPKPSPDGFLGFTKWAAAETAKITEADSANTTEVAGMFEANGSALAAGGIKTREELLSQTAEFLNARGPAWQTFRASLRSELGRLGFQSRPKDEFSKAWSAIAAGVRSTR
jgi:hypothetical protein